MDTEGPSALGDADKTADEVRELLGERRELVDNDDEPWHRLGSGAAKRDARTPGVDIGRAGGSQHSLAAAELGRQRVDRAGRRRGIEIGQHAEGVRQPGAGSERRAAFEVDEKHVEIVRRVIGNEGGDQRLQQFAFSGPRGPGDQQMRAIGVQVDDERSGGADAETGGR
jgi:hypothetical protein